MNMKKIITLIAVSCLLAPSSTIFADTYDTGSWTSGDGTTEVSVAIESSYEVTIPESLELPHTNTYTNAGANVGVTSGATIPKNETILVTLAEGQTFTAAYDASTSVPYMVKINTNDGIANTTGSAAEVLRVDSTTAHDTGATSSVNVGFDSAPNYKYAGTYTGSIQFNVSCAFIPAPTPGPATNIVLGGEEFQFVKQEGDKYLVMQKGDIPGQTYYKGTETNYSPYYGSGINAKVDSWFNSTYGMSNIPTEDTIQLDGYTVYKTTLNGARSTSQGYISGDGSGPDGSADIGFVNETAQNKYNSVPLGGPGVYAITAYAFVLSKADLDAQTTDAGFSTALSERLSNGTAYWLRSPGNYYSNAAGVAHDANFGTMQCYGQYQYYVRAAFWVSVDQGE